jgi:hypothetical protein
MLFPNSIHLWEFVYVCKVYPPREDFTRPDFVQYSVSLDLDCG